MHVTDIVIKPLITEKATFQSESGRYTFQVDRAATKSQIKSAVEELYSVRVTSVATMIRKGQERRNRHGVWRTKNVKRAIVKVHPDDRIELF